MRMRILIAALLGLIVTMTTGRAEALTVGFSFNDDSTANLVGRTHLGGSVTGFLFGLQDNLANQIPTGLKLTSDVSGLGMTQTTYNSFLITGGAGLSISGGQVTAADLILILDDVTVGNTQLAFNTDELAPGGRENRLIWNGGSGPFGGIGNAGGFAGATYSIATTPIPATLPLLASALGGLGFVGWRHRRNAA